MEETGLALIESHFPSDRWLFASVLLDWGYHLYQ